MSTSERYNKLLSDYDNQAKTITALQDANTALTLEGTDANKVATVRADLQKAVQELETIKANLIQIQNNTNKDIEETASSIVNYRKTLNNNHQLFQQYSDDIKNKMQLVATRDRMLQLSQERNMYKTKIIYVLFSIIVALLIAVISAYTVFGKKSNR